MNLIYKFKKEKVNGELISRPRVPIILQGKTINLELSALIDSGSDFTVIPESIAKALDLNLSGVKGKLFAFRESSDVIKSYADVTFKQDTNKITLNKAPILVVLSNEKYDDENDIILGVNGIFDHFKIIFDKLNNKIILESKDR